MKDKFMCKNILVLLQALFRGSKKIVDDECESATALINARIQKGGLRLRRWLIALLVFLLMSLYIINSYNTGQFRIIRFGGNAKTDAQSVVTRKLRLVIR